MAHLSAFEIRMNAAAAVKEARENVGYWQNQKIMRTQPPAIAEAAARVSVWKTTLAAREAKLDALSQPKPTKIINCESGIDYGICPACGKGHGHSVPISQAKPTLGLRLTR